jgi:hypothetical protein
MATLCCARQYDKATGSYSEYQCAKGYTHKGNHKAATGEEWTRENPYVDDAEKLARIEEGYEKARRDWPIVTAPERQY